MMFQSCIGTAQHNSESQQLQNHRTNAFIDTGSPLANTHILTEKSSETPTLLKPHGFMEKVSAAIESLRSIGHKPQGHILAHHNKLQPIDHLHERTTETYQSVTSPTMTPSSPLTSQRHRELITETKVLLEKHEVISQTPIQLNQEIRDHFQAIAHEYAGKSITEFEDYESVADPKPQADKAEELTCLRDLLFSLQVLDFTFQESDTFFILNLLNGHSALSAGDTKALIILFGRQEISMKNVKENLAELMNNDLTTNEAQLGAMSAYIELLNNDPLKVANCRRYIKDFSSDLNDNARQLSKDFSFIMKQNGHSLMLSLQKPEEAISPSASSIRLGTLFSAKSKLPY